MDSRECQQHIGIGGASRDPEGKGYVTKVVPYPRTGRRTMECCLLDKAGLLTHELQVPD